MKYPLENSCSCNQSKSVKFGSRLDIQIDGWYDCRLGQYTSVGTCICARVGTYQRHSGLTISEKLFRIMWMLRWTNTRSDATRVACVHNRPLQLPLVGPVYSQVYVHMQFSIVDFGLWQNGVLNAFIIRHGSKPTLIPKTSYGSIMIETYQFPSNSLQKIHPLLLPNQPRRAKICGRTWSKLGSNRLHTDKLQQQQNDSQTFLKNSKKFFEPVEKITLLSTQLHNRKLHVILDEWPLLADCWYTCSCTPACFLMKKEQQGPMLDQEVRKNHDVM